MLDRGVDFLRRATGWYDRQARRDIQEVAAWGMPIFERQGGFDNYSGGQMRGLRRATRRIIKDLEKSVARLERKVPGSRR